MSDDLASKSYTPDWAKKQYQKQYKREDLLWDLGKDIAGDMQSREILGPNRFEELGLQEAIGGYDTAGKFLTEAGDFTGYDDALSALGGMAGEYGNFNTNGYDRLANKNFFDKPKRMEKYWDLGRRGGERLKDFETNRIGDKTLDEMRAGYESEYTDDVVNTTLAGADRRRDAERLREQLASTAAGGTSNTRGAIAGAVSDQLYGMNRSEREAMLRDAAFERAATLGQQEAQLGQKEDQMNYDFLQGGLDFQSGIQSDWLGMEFDRRENKANWSKDLLDSKLGYEWDKLEAKDQTYQNVMSGERDRRADLESLSNQWAGLGSAKGAVLSDYGGTARGLEQAQMDADRTHQMEMLSWLQGIQGGFQGQGMPNNNSESYHAPAPEGPSTGQTLLGLAASFLSDEEAKTDITDVDDGALDAISSWGVKSYRYKDGMPGHRTDRHSGLIAQDIEKTNPDAVMVGADGLRRVDPWSVSATIVKAVQELSEATQPHRKWSKAAGIS